MTSHRQPTIQDVASHAGVSVATVSRVMNNSGKVREQTRLRVDAAIEELDYRPSWLARDFRQDKTGRILVLFPSLHSPVMADVFRGIDDMARTEGYFCLICPTAKDASRELELVQLLLNRSVDGIIFFGTTLDVPQLAALGERHAVVQCAEWKDASLLSRVSIDDRQAAIDVTEHLVEEGHRRIAMVTNRGEASGVLREEGYRAALTAAGIQIDESLVLQGDYEFASGRRAIAAMMQMAEPPSAVFCVSDVVAAGAVVEARVLGLEVPGDLAIAGFDDSREAMLSIPELTTIRQPFYEIGRHAMQALLHSLADPTGSSVPTHEILPHQLIVRGSTTATTFPASNAEKTAADRKDDALDPRHIGPRPA